MTTRICPGWSELTHIGEPKEMGVKEGVDGNTHGICEDCYAAMMATVPLAQPAITENLVTQLEDVL